MNQRIKELAEQSGLHCDKYGLFFAEEHHDEGVDLEKFVELIVKECVEQVRGEYLPVMEDATMMTDPYWVGYKHCGVDSIVAIQQHFGVNSASR